MSTIQTLQKAIEIRARENARQRVKKLVDVLRNDQDLLNVLADVKVGFDDVTAASVYHGLSMYDELRTTDSLLSNYIINRLLPNEIDNETKELLSVVKQCGQYLEQNEEGGGE